MAALSHSNPYRSALNRRGWWREEGIEPFPYHRIALARCLFEGGAVEDRNIRTMISYEACTLQALGGERNRLSIGAQH